MKKKKKVIIASLFAIVICTIFTVKALITNALENVPNITAKIEDCKSLNIMRYSKFNIKISIDPGAFKDVHKCKDYKGDYVYIDVNLPDGIDIESIDNGTLDGNKIKINNIKYEKQGDRFIGQPSQVNIKLQANKYGTYSDDSFKDSFILEYKDVEGKIRRDNIEGKIGLEVKEIKLNEPSMKLKEKTIEETQWEVDKPFNIQYEINNAKPQVEVEEGKNLDLSKKRIIYVIDKETLDMDGALNTKSNEMLKESLRDFNKEAYNEDVKFSLIAYDSKAQVIKHNEKDIYSVDDLIEEIGVLKKDDDGCNLGDAIRKATRLYKNDREYKTSIVIVSSGKLNYKSVKDEGEVADFDEEDYEVEKNKDDDGALDYAYAMVDKTIDEKVDIDWFGIDYSEKRQEGVVAKVISKLSGECTKGIRPSMDDYKDILNKASSDITVNEQVTVESNSKDLSIKNNEEKNNAYYKYDKNKNEFKKVGEENKKDIEITSKKEGDFNIGDSKRVNAYYVANLKEDCDRLSEVKVNSEESEAIIRFKNSEISAFGLFRGLVPKISEDSVSAAREACLIDYKEQEPIDMAEDSFIEVAEVFEVTNSGYYEFCWYESISSLNGNSNSTSSYCIGGNVGFGYENGVNCYKLEGGTLKNLGTNGGHFDKGVYLVTKKYKIKPEYKGYTIKIGFKASDRYSNQNKKNHISFKVVEKPKHF